MSNEVLEREEKVEAAEVAEALEKMAPEDKEKIFYMIKGVELLGEKG